MKIMLYTETYNRGGIDTFIATLMNHWPEAGDEFVLVCNEDYPGLEVIRQRLERPCKVVTHRIPTYARWAEKTRGNKLMDTFRVCSSPLSRYLFIASATRMLGKILLGENCDRLMVVNGGFPGADTCRAAGIAWGLYSGKPKSIHNFHNLGTAASRCARLQEDRLDSLLARHSKAFVTVSRAAAESLSVRPKIYADRAKVRFVYNGLDFSHEPPPATDIRAELSLAPDTPLCLMLGTYEPRKGHRFLLQVFQKTLRRVPQARFVICGHGSAEEIAAVQGMAQEFNIGANVHVLDFRSDAMQILRQADLLLVGSQEFESFGLTCVEAMANRVPVLATRVGGLPEVVQDGDGGFTFAKDDVDGYAEQMVRLLLDRELHAEQGRKGYERYRRLFTAQRMTEEYAKLIR
ncbi:glycosyltransferase family 4 protein [Geomonas azotofigens]|uniref:glycosyltransferase family 4 protein n=1 Tax=Geomonas azotofigens TaxID=2843196 RepID=UPI001C11BAF1|nr:glycosyltransferase family 4 protein [Geomonas azotofigens]MBU5615231.1 glycosyltransferase family 4 protein [Geomonas azotofigens]